MKVAAVTNILYSPEKFKTSTFKAVVYHHQQPIPDYYGIAYPTWVEDGVIKGSVCYPIPINLFIALYDWFRRKFKNPWVQDRTDS